VRLRIKMRVQSRASYVCAAVFLLAVSTWAGPLDFGLGEINAAFAERKLKWKVKTDLSMDPPESFLIEPYAYGGAHVTGGDLRGLMYGLLEAAEQMRVNGRMVRTRGKAATLLRGVRITVTPELESASEDFWRSYFQRLARNRFNRAHVIVPLIQAPFGFERRLSQIAADYAVDFTLGFEGDVSLDDVHSLLTACPLIHSLAVEPGFPSTNAILEAAKQIGRRVTVDLDGSTPVEETEIPFLKAIGAWPPSFEMNAPFDVRRAEEHETYFWVWGRFGYNPTVKLPKNADPAAYNAAREATLWVAAAAQVTSGGSEYVASSEEATSIRNGTLLSAKLLPADLADHLDTAAARIPMNSSEADLLLIAEAARQQSAALRADYGASHGVPGAAHPKATHIPPGNWSAGQPLTLRLQIAATPAALKGLGAVRLHYRLLDPAAKEVVLDVPAAADVAFTIPGSELDGTWDVQYYFEILNKQGSGWFEPDAATGMPLWVAKIIPSRTGPN
jgi:hypothetical protein